MRGTKKIFVGEVAIGDGSPVSIQSMANTPTKDVDATVEQINRLTVEGCDIVRVAVPDMESAKAISKIKEKIDIPLVADIHFHHELALEAIASGADKIRINPGNIKKKEYVGEIAKAAKKRNIPIRVGVNSGSIDRDLLFSFENPADALVKSAMDNVSLLESFDFDDIVVSVKSSHVNVAIDAYRKLSKLTGYPLHLGLTEAGTGMVGTVKSSIMMGTLINEGIGDTIRVSLTADPALEVKVGRAILNSLGVRKTGVDLISCPTCARCEIDLIGLAESVENELSGVKDHLTVAVMGCVVNGPGEASDADVGIAAGKGQGMLFSKGKPIKKVPENELLDAILSEVKKLTE